MTQTAKPATNAYPNPESIPCRNDPEIRRLMANATPCRCGSRSLIPMSNAQRPPEFAVTCNDCEAFKGFVSSLADAVTNWNAWAASNTKIPF